MSITTVPRPAPQRLGYDDLGRLMALQTGDEKHSYAATSTLDVLWVLYHRVLRVAPHLVDDPDRDRFVLSKGHGPRAYYAVLAAKGFIDVDVLPTFAAFDSPLGHHPDGRLLPGVEVGSGSLGHGLPIAVGMALALRQRPPDESRRRPRVVCLVGDGELDEGSNHEAIAFAGRTLLRELTVVVVDNRSSSHGWPGGIERRFALEGWDALTVDGRDHDALHEALGPPNVVRPRAVIASVERKGSDR